VSGAAVVDDVTGASNEQLEDWLSKLEIQVLARKRLIKVVSESRSSNGGKPKEAESFESEMSPHVKNKVKKGQWRLGEKIGQGAFGLVYKGMNTANGEIIAIKELNYGLYFANDHQSVHPAQQCCCGLLRSGEEEAAR
jgi:hypothetical protein